MPSCQHCICAQGQTPADAKSGLLDVIFAVKSQVQSLTVLFLQLQLPWWLISKVLRYCTAWLSWPITCVDTQLPAAAVNWCRLFGGSPSSPLLLFCDCSANAARLTAACWRIGRASWPLFLSPRCCSASASEHACGGVLSDRQSITHPGNQQEFHMEFIGD
jgi:hypothetical protein